MDKYISIPKAVEELRKHGVSITKQTLYNRVKNDTIPYKQVGKKNKVKMSDLLSVYESKIEQEQPNEAIPIDKPETLTEAKELLIKGFCDLSIKEFSPSNVRTMEKLLKMINVIEDKGDKGDLIIIFDEDGTT